MKLGKSLTRSTGLALVAAMFLMGSVVSCTSEEETTEEVVTTTTEETAQETPVETTPEPAVVDTETPAEMPSFAPVFFAFDDYTLSADAQETLNRVHEFLVNVPNVVVQVEGHADNRGSIEYNLALGERRAQAVKNYLIQLGVDSSRLPTISYGEERPVAEGNNEASWAQNRRAAFVPSGN